MGRLRNHDAARASLAKRDLLCCAEIADTIEVPEKIQNEWLIGHQQRENRRPEIGGLLAVNRFAALGFQNFQANRLDVSAQIQRSDIQRKRGEVQSFWFGRTICRTVHSSSSILGNFSRKSGACLRTSSQSKNGSGFSSQTWNQFAISSFSAPLSASTLWLPEIISARRLPSRATTSTRSAAAFSPCVLKRRSSSSMRIKLTSPSLRLLTCTISSHAPPTLASASPLHCS